MDRIDASYKPLCLLLSKTHLLIHQLGYLSNRYTLKVCDDVNQLIAFLESSLVALVIVDEKIDSDPRALCRKIGERKAETTLWFVVSNHLKKSYLQQFSQIGVHDFIAFPIDPFAVDKKIEKAMQSRRFIQKLHPAPELFAKLNQQSHTLAVILTQTTCSSVGKDVQVNHFAIPLQSDLTLFVFPDIQFNRLKKIAADMLARSGEAFCYGLAHLVVDKTMSAKQIYLHLLTVAFLSLHYNSRKE